MSNKKRKIGDDIARQLSVLKTNFAETIVQNNVEGAIPIIRKSWEVLSTAAQTSRSDNLPPLFNSQAVNCAFESIATLFCVVEGHALFGDRVGKESSGNILLSGVKGVGKSTIMRGFVEITRSLSDNIFPVFCDLNEEFSRPLELVRQAHNIRWPDQEIPPVANITELAKELSQRAHYAALFMDELDVAYVAADRELGKRIVADVLLLGKSSNHFAVVSGSSAHMTDYAFKRVPMVADFPDLNHSVFAEKRIHPLSCKGDLRQMLLQRGIRDSILTDAFVNEVFQKTGGIGRNIVLYLASKTANIAIAELRTCFAKSAPLRSVLHCLHTSSSPETDPGWIWTMFKASRQELGTIIERHAVPAGDVDNLLYQWVDAGLLGINDDFEFSFLIPEHRRIFVDFMQSKADRRLLLAWEWLLLGWEHPGACVEPDLLQLINDSGLLPFNASYDPNHPRISTAVGAPHRAHLAEYLGQLLRWTDHGMDGAAVEMDPTSSANDIRVLLHGVQFKMGGTHLKLGKGGKHGWLKIQQRAAAQRDLLADVLNRWFPGTRVKLATLTVVTSKQLAPSCQISSPSIIGGESVDVVIVQSEEFLSLLDQNMLSSIGLRLR